MDISETQNRRDVLVERKMERSNGHLKHIYGNLVAQEPFSSIEGLDTMPHNGFAADQIL